MANQVTLLSDPVFLQMQAALVSVCCRAEGWGVGGGCVCAVSAGSGSSPFGYLLLCYCVSLSHPKGHQIRRQFDNPMPK